MYEGANFGQIILATLWCCVAFSSILQGVLCLLSTWVNFTFRREDAKYSVKYANFLYSRVFDDKDMFYGFCMNVVVLFLLAIMVQSAILYTSTFVIFVIGAGIILSFTFLPRLLVDFCKGLKYNKTTGEVDRIKELEKQGEALAKQIKELKENK